MKYSAYISVILAFLLAGCSGKGGLQPEVAEGELIIVPVSVGTSDYECDDLTKSLVPYIPDVENLIHDIWVVQYSSRGVLLPRATYHYRTDAEGSLVVDDVYYSDSSTSGFALVESIEPCTICFVANMGDNVPEWPDNIHSYREIMMPVLSTDYTDRLTKIPMCGYYHGPITHGTKVNVSLGRMITRLNLVINNHTEKQMTDLVVSISNAPRYAPIYPNTDLTPFNTAEEEVRDFSDSGLILEAGESINVYYYIAPNLYGESWPTILWTSCNLDGVPMKGAMILGDTAPEPSENESWPPVASEERDLRLYPNNLYTFTINYVDNL